MLFKPKTLKKKKQKLCQTTFISQPNNNSKKKKRKDLGFTGSNIIAKEPSLHTVLPLKIQTGTTCKLILITQLRIEE
jgi:hypothetical protein